MEGSLSSSALKGATNGSSGSCPFEGREEVDEVGEAGAVEDEVDAAVEAVLLPLMEADEEVESDAEEVASLVLLLLLSCVPDMVAVTSGRCIVFSKIVKKATCHCRHAPARGLPCNLQICRRTDQVTHQSESYLSLTQKVRFQIADLYMMYSGKSLDGSCNCANVC